MAALHTASREIRLVASWNIFRAAIKESCLARLTHSLKRLWRAPCAAAVSFLVKALHNTNCPIRLGWVRENRLVRPGTTSK